MRFGTACLLAVAVFSGRVQAQQPARITVDAVEIRGLERVNEQLIRSQIEVQAGQTYSPRAISRDIRRLYDLGFFATIRADDRVDEDGRTTIVYTFLEERFIGEVRIIGNKKVKDRAIRGVLTWREGDSFVKEGYDEERDALLELYRSKGFLNTTVDIIVEEISASRVRVTYVFDEGRKARIRKIRLQGNQALSDRQLRRHIKTRRAYWFFGGRYDEDKFEADLFNVIDAYANVGRLEAEIAATAFETSKKGKRIAISIFINEGPEYHVATLDIANNVVFGDDELLENISVKAGDLHSKSKVSEDALGLQERYLDNGYINARVVPQVTLNREQKTTTVVHQIREGNLKFIRQVNITGNSVTKDDVIRRQILLRPGERFDGSLYRASENRLKQTQFFKGVRLGVDDVPENDHFTDVLVDIEEGKTGNFNFGGAFNTDRGVLGFGELRLNNFDITNWPTFSGGGQRFSTRFSIGQVRTNLRVSFTDPEFAGTPLSFGVDVFNERFRGTGGTNFTQETLGGQLRLGKALSHFTTARASIGYTDVDITNLGTFVDPGLRELQDPGSTLAIGFGISRNTVNNFRDPTAGARHDLDVELTGFGLDNEYVKLSHSSTWYYGLKRWKKWSFSFTTREGLGIPYGDKALLPLQSRFFAGGGSTLRGYDFRDVGPKAKTFRVVNGQVLVGEEAIGGEVRLLNTIETKYVLNDLVRLYTFVDSGGVWLTPSDFDFSDFKFGVGVGIGLQVPFLGPIRIDYGYPINPDDDQGSGQLHLQSSFRF